MCKQTMFVQKRGCSCSLKCHGGNSCSNQLYSPAKCDTAQSVSQTSPLLLHSSSNAANLPLYITTSSSSNNNQDNIQKNTKSYTKVILYNIIMSTFYAWIGMYM